MGICIADKLNKLKRIGGYGTIYTNDGTGYPVDLSSIEIKLSWTISTVSFKSSKGKLEELDLSQIRDGKPFITRSNDDERNT